MSIYYRITKNISIYNIYIYVFQSVLSTRLDSSMIQRYSKFVTKSDECLANEYKSTNIVLYIASTKQTNVLQYICKETRQKKTKRVHTQTVYIIEQYICTR
jgi:hypothetical protein